MELPTVVPQASGPRGPASAPGEAEPGRWRTALRFPGPLACAVCVGAAAVSAAALPTVPSYDPWAWIVWGRELVDPHLVFALGGGPSWKPLPVIFTAVFGLLGGAAPTLWVIVARAGGLLGLVAAYRLAARVAGGRAPGAAAGMLAAAALVLTQQWGYYMLRGTSEPLLIGASLWAIDRHLAGRRASAFVLAVATSLLRPEAWPFLAVYALWLWIREPRLRLMVLAGLASVPLLWFVPPWIASGQPFLAAVHAHDYNGHLGGDRLLTVLRRGVDLQVAPALVYAAIAAALALVFPRSALDHLTLWLGGLIAAWWAVVVVMTLVGYPGLERFYLPAAALTCALAGAGIARVALAAGSAAARSGRWPLQAAVTIALIAVAGPFGTSRISALRAQEPLAAHAVTRVDELGAAVAAVGGHRRVYPCHTSFAAINHTLQSALAWKLHVSLGRVGTSMRHQGVMFVGPHDTIDGAPPRVDPRLTERRLIARVGAWRVYRMTSPGADTRCVGS